MALCMARHEQRASHACFRRLIAVSSSQLGRLRRRTAANSGGCMSHVHGCCLLYRSVSLSGVCSAFRLSALQVTACNPSISLLSCAASPLLQVLVTHPSLRLLHLWPLPVPLSLALPVGYGHLQARVATPPPPLPVARSASLASRYSGHKVFRCWLAKPPCPHHSYLFAGSHDGPAHIRHWPR